jgi:hypothetical protein
MTETRVARTAELPDDILAIWLDQASDAVGQFGSGAGGRPANTRVRVAAQDARHNL